MCFIKIYSNNNNSGGIIIISLLYNRLADNKLCNSDCYSNASEGMHVKPLVPAIYNPFIVDR
jgi:hypothetical protein